MIWVMDKKILVIVPAYNEEESIRKVIESIENQEIKVDVVVINDGSKDRTYKEASKTDAYVIDLPFNLGIGGAMQTGYLYAFKNKYDIAIQIDADGQHNPEDIKNLIQPLLDEEADMVIGSRYLEKTQYKSTLLRRLGMIYFTTVIKIFTGNRITDTTSGYRAVDRKVIKMFAREYPEDYPEVEVLVWLKKRRLKIKEISVEMNERTTGKSSITPFKSLYYMIKVTLGIIISSIRKF